MNDHLELAFRIGARRNGRAMTIASSSAYAADRGDSFGYAPIRVVSEERLQAAAFGVIADEPSLVREALPMGRATAFLEPLSDALEKYLERSIQDRNARLYVPHGQAAETFWLLGERYENNLEASDKVKRLGFIGRVLAELMRFPGQQVVVNLGEALAAHLVSGGNKTQDLQLRYLLEWINPATGVDVLEAAEKAALVPSASMMTRDDDDRVEHLRKALKRRRDDAALRATIERILDISALSEWSLLTAGLQAYHGLGLPCPRQLDKIYDGNLDWLARQIADPRAASSRTFAMAALLEEHSTALNDHDAAMVDGDDRRFRTECESGRAAFIDVMEINRLGRGRTIQPVHIRAMIDQPVLRLRPDAGVRFVGSKIEATVLEIARPTPDGPYQVLLELTKGLRNALTIAQGTRLRLVDGQRIDLRIHKNKVLAAARVIDKPVLVHDELPPATGLLDPRVDLVAVLAALESRQ